MTTDDHDRPHEDRPITRANAARLAFRAATEVVNIPARTAPVVEERGDELVVTFPTAIPIGVLGPAYHARVFLDRRTGAVRKILGGS